MSYALQRSQAELRFLAGWTADGVLLRTPVALPNRTGLLTRIDGSAPIPVPPEDTPWVRFAIDEGTQAQADLASVAWMRALGELQLQLFTPQGVGDTLARRLADFAVPIFRRAQFGGFTCGGTRFELAPDPQGDWMQANLYWTFRRDELAPVAL